MQRLAIRETIASAKEPLQIKWFGDSFIVFPVGK
jgi:hypothetical protein